MLRGLERGKQEKDLRIKKERERDGNWLIRMFGKRGECAYAIVGLSGPVFEVSFPSDWHEEKRGWIRIGCGLLKVAFQFPWPWLSEDDGQCSGHKYGFAFFGNSVHLHWGKPHGKRDDPFTVIDIPWQNWRFVRQSWYGPTGQHIETLWETKNKEGRSAQWEWRHEFEKTLAKTRFEVEDFDGKRIGVSTHIEEREWRFGIGLFEWLSLFRKHKVRRTLEINFDHEVGPEKGSWKGGLMGTSIDMEPGELHEAAFRRYCDTEHRDRNGKYRIKMVGVA